MFFNAECTFLLCGRYFFAFLVFFSKWCTVGIATDTWYMMVRSDGWPVQRGTLEFFNIILPPEPYLVCVPFFFSVRVPPASSILVWVGCVASVGRW